MWTADDLHRAAEKRSEHLKMAPDVEKVILALERAMGRTEEVLRRELAKDHLRDLLAVLDAATVPEFVTDLYPALAKAKPPTRNRPRDQIPLPLPAQSIDGKAVRAMLKDIEADLRVSSPSAPERVVNLEVQAVKTKNQTKSGPSR